MLSKVEQVDSPALITIISCSLKNHVQDDPISYEIAFRTLSPRKRRGRISLKKTTTKKLVLFDRII
jgi:hypothetical protein